MALQLRGTGFLNSSDFGLGYWWIDTLTYASSEQGSDHDLLAALIAHPAYRHDYASPRGDAPATGQVHGPYRITSIAPETFVSVRRDRALTQLDNWLHRNEATPEALDAFRAMIDRHLPPGHRIYTLRDLGEHEWHEWGGVVGVMGFLEYVAISPDSTALSLLVATDD